MYTLKYKGPFKNFKDSSYKETYEVVDGLTTVKYLETRDHLLRLGFEEVTIEEDVHSQPAVES